MGRKVDALIATAGKEVLVKIQEDQRETPPNRGHVIAVTPKMQPVHLAAFNVKVGVSCNFNFSDR